jgi:hypothetical protein
MTCADDILRLLTTARHTGEFTALPYSPSTVWAALTRLKRAKCVRRVRPGVWVKTGKPYQPERGIKKPDGPRECAEALNISRQRAYTLIKAGLAWKENGEWKRKHTRAGRPKV